jgi:hypothetical protein
MFQANIAEKKKYVQWLFPPKPFRSWDSMEQYGKTGQATGDNITWRMRIACWVLRLRTPPPPPAYFVNAPECCLCTHIASLVLFSSDTEHLIFFLKTGNVCEPNFEWLSCNRCCSAKWISISHSKCVFVALGIQHEMRKRNIVICGLSGSLKFFPHYPIKRSVFEKKNNLEIKCVFLFSYNFLLKHLHSKKNWSKVYICLHIKYLLFLSYVTESWIFGTYFRKIL